MNNAKILLVEDEHAQRLLYKEELEEEGYRVFDAKNGDEALEIVTSQRPDLAILDIFLAGEDGLELMGRLLNLNADMPIILHSAYGQWKDNWRGKIADAYVVKSADMANLKTTIKRVIYDSRKANS
jgi:DNA-binding response OmpR family regulator